MRIIGDSRNLKEGISNTIGTRMRFRDAISIDSGRKFGEGSNDRSLPSGREENAGIKARRLVNAEARHVSNAFDSYNVMLR